MKPIPQNILGGFNDLMKQRKVPPMFLGDYRKWLLYFLDFRAKYSLPDSPSEHLRVRSLLLHQSFFPGRLGDTVVEIVVLTAKHA